MIYFSELKGRKVVTEDNINFGRLEDIIFLAYEKPVITKLVVRNEKDKYIIPINYLIKINNPITVRKDFTTSLLDENELYLVKNLLDKQIIDLSGNKVVRVNDVIIQDKFVLALSNNKSNQPYISGVDIGVFGILRWIGLEKAITRFFNIFNIRLVSQFLSWSDIQLLELMRGKVKLNKQEEKLKRIRPEDLAYYLEKTSVANVKKFLKILDVRQATEVINSLNLNYQADLFKHFQSDKAVALLDLIDPDEACDILLTLPKKKREAIIDSLSEKKRKKVKYLLNLSNTQIGRLITTEYLTVEPDDSVSKVINKIKQEIIDFSQLDYIYVVNKENQLIGAFSLYELISQDSDVLMYKFMIQSVIVLHMTTSKEVAIEKMVKYKLQAIPVIDENKHILGIVTFDDLLEKDNERIF